MQHDDLCPVIATDCAQCPQCALIARVRAHERDLGWANAANLQAATLAEAEQVAARLVEVIVRQDEYMSWGAIVRLANERDAARAEVAALRGQQEIYLANSYNAGWRAALADLRAKVTEMRDFWQTYLDANPTNVERPLAWSRWDTLRGVLALIEEAGRPVPGLHKGVAVTESFGHSDIDPAWVEAGVKAYRENGLDLYDAALDMDPHNVSVVIAAVEPLIREQIAQQIEADGKGWYVGEQYAQRYAAIARGQA